MKFLVATFTGFVLAMFASLEQATQIHGVFTTVDAIFTTGVIVTTFVSLALFIIFFEELVN